MHIHATTVTMEKQQVLHIPSVALAIWDAIRMFGNHLWHVWLYNIFPHYLINGMNLEKKNLLNIKCVF
jgi:hypothetical protein